LAAKLGFAATLASGLFLYLIAIMYIIALIGMSRAFAKFQRGSCSDAELEAALNDRNFRPRLPAPDHEWHQTTGADLSGRGAVRV
jgi:nickel/cobalt transporter (NiCoT) family protein